MRCVIFLALFVIGLYGETLRIVGAVPFGSANLRLEGSRNIVQKDISLHKLNDTTAFIDIYGVWVPKGKREYNFPNNTQIIVAQNNPQRLRVLITLNNKTEFEYYIKNKYFYVAIKEKAKTTQQTQKGATKTPPPKSTQSDTKTTSQKPTSNTPAKTPVSTPTPPPVKTQPPQKPKNQPKPILVSKTKPSAKNAKIVILDPGHGGKDCGARGVLQVCEKDIVLSVAKLTAKELDKMGYVVYMTRNSDVFIELQRRTEMANEIHADLFISIHANSIPNNSTRQPKGVETYFLSTARTERAINVAAAENQGMAEYSPNTIASFLTSNRIIASNKLAMDIQAGILKEIKMQYSENLDGGVREGPFWVLVGALMPSVLVEIGYNSHPIEAKRLVDLKYQTLLARGIANGVTGYIRKNP